MSKVSSEIMETLLCVTACSAPGDSTLAVLDVK